jgi:chromosome segregation ATPase
MAGLKSALRDAVDYHSAVEKTYGRVAEQIDELADNTKHVDNTQSIANRVQETAVLQKTLVEDHDTTKSLREQFDKLHLLQPEPQQERLEKYKNEVDQHGIVLQRLENEYNAQQTKQAPVAELLQTQLTTYGEMLGDVGVYNTTKSQHLTKLKDTLAEYGQYQSENQKLVNELSAANRQYEKNLKRYRKALKKRPETRAPPPAANPITVERAQTGYTDFV